MLALLLMWIGQASIIPEHVEIDHMQRDYLLVLPTVKTEKSVPVVFAFHGHGGNMRFSAKKFRIHELWPEAIVVYPQGLPTPGMTDPEGKKNGWQRTVGDQGDRDLKLFDAILERLAAKHNVDTDRVYATGHSNGGAFSYLLANARSDKLAAIAPSAAAARIGLRASAGEVQSIPVFHAGATNDPIVNFAMQQRTIDSVIKHNQCSTTSEPWHKVGKEYSSRIGKPVVTYIHDRGHGYPEQLPELIVAFFQENSRSNSR